MKTIKIYTLFTLLVQCVKEGSFEGFVAVSRSALTSIPQTDNKLFIEFNSNWKYFAFKAVYAGGMEIISIIRSVNQAVSMI